LETHEALPHKAFRPIPPFISNSPTRFALSGQASTDCINLEAKRGAALRDSKGTDDVFSRGVSEIRPDRALLRRPQVSGRPESGGPCV